MKGESDDPPSFGGWQTLVVRNGVGAPHIPARRGEAPHQSYCQNREILKVRAQHALDDVKCESQKDSTPPIVTMNLKE